MLSYLELFPHPVAWGKTIYRPAIARCPSEAAPDQLWIRPACLASPISSPKRRMLAPARLLEGEREKRKEGGNVGGTEERRKRDKIGGRGDGKEGE